MPKSRRDKERSPSTVKRSQKKEQQAQRGKEERRFEKEKNRAEAGRRGAMRAFTAPQSDSDLSEQVAMEAEQEGEQDLGAAAPAAQGSDRYHEEQKRKREKAKAHAKEREDKRRRSEDKGTQEISDEADEDIDISKWKSIAERTPEDFHQVMKQQDREIRELKQDKQRQKETNAVFSKVIAAQGAAQKRSEETSALYNYEPTGLPRDDSPESKREFVMWCTEQAGIPPHEVSSIEYVDMRRMYGVQTAVIRFGNKGNRTKMSKWMMQYKAWNPLKCVLQWGADMGTVQHHRKVSRNSRAERKKGLLECSTADPQRARRRRET